ncbi:hypothetical protein BB987_21120 [Photorhabdus temperata]|uniref:Uncharacterized protein n=1 Tax=Photorhabdus khanii NC19 TaxID=1004151 RepID=W3V602_9GAMM|nr:hypothetical protein PTE_03183 [Photorhabdus khanii NC19]OHV57543.1 hypothetical protein BB987_21120 [Photorhabdus temperata]
MEIFVNKINLDHFQTFPEPKSRWDFYCIKCNGIFDEICNYEFKIENRDCFMFLSNKYHVIAARKSGEIY